MADVDVPVIGDVDSRWLYAAGALVAGVAGYAYLTRGRLGTMDTGDVAFGEAGEVYDAHGNLIGQPGSTPDYVPPTVVDSNVDVDDRGPQPTTNAEWARLARDELVAFGADGPTVTAALGRFLDRKSLTAIEAGLVREAIAVAGYPPQGGPWTVVESTVTPPPAAGLLAPPATFRALGPVRWSGSTPIYRLTWSPVQGARDYHLVHVGGSGNFVSGTAIDNKGSSPGRVDRWRVAARDSAGRIGSYRDLSFTAAKRK